MVAHVNEEARHCPALGEGCAGPIGTGTWAAARAKFETPPEHFFRLLARIIHSGLVSVA